MPAAQVSHKPLEILQYKVFTSCGVVGNVPGAPESKEVEWKVTYVTVVTYLEKTFEKYKKISCIAFCKIFFFFIVNTIMFRIMLFKLCRVK